MYCWNCGKEIDGKVTFCPHCGMKQAEPVKPPREKPQRGSLIPVICAAVCVGALLGMLLIMGSGDDPESQQTTLSAKRRLTR